MEINYRAEKNLFGENRICAELDLHKIYGTNITGGTLYAYGDDEAQAKRNLLSAIETLTQKLEEIN